MEIPLNESNQKSDSSPELSALIAQLPEINKRSQIYLSRFWQIPFAYLGGTLVIVSNLNYDSNNKKIVSFVLILSIIIGLLVLLHMYYIQKRNITATNNLILLEEKLKFNKIDNNYKIASLACRGYWASMYLIVISSMVGYIYLLFSAVICVKS